MLVRWAQSTPIRSQIDASVVVLQVKVTSNYLQDEILTDAARAALQRPRLRRLVVSRSFIYSARIWILKLAGWKQETPGLSSCSSHQLAVSFEYSKVRQKPEKRWLDDDVGSRLVKMAAA